MKTKISLLLPCLLFNRKDTKRNERITIVVHLLAAERESCCLPPERDGTAGVIQFTWSLATTEAQPHIKTKTMQRWLVCPMHDAIHGLRRPHRKMTVRISLEK